MASAPTVKQAAAHLAARARRAIGSTSQGARLFLGFLACVAAAVGVPLALAATVDPNMGFTNPEVGDPGTGYATNIRASLTTIGAHDHTAGKGLKVPTAGYNENADHEMNQNDLTEIRTLRFDPTGATIVASDRRALYHIGGELAYIDDAGLITTITNNGSVSGPVGTITGMTGSATVVYSPSTNTYAFTDDAGAPGGLDSGCIRIAEEVVGGKGPVICADPATAADFNFTFPSALPGANRVLCLDASGALTGCTASAAAQAFVVATSTSSGTISATSTIVAGTTVRALTGGFGVASTTGGDSRAANATGNTTTTPADIGGTSFAGLTASEAYFISCRFQVSSAASTTGVQIGLDFSPAAASAAYDCGSWSDTSVWTYQATTGDDSRCVMTTTVAGAESTYTLSGWFLNSAAATSVVARLRSEVAASLVTVHAGLCTVTPATP